MSYEEQAPERSTTIIVIGSGCADVLEKRLGTSGWRVQVVPTRAEAIRLVDRGAAEAIVVCWGRNLDLPLADALRGLVGWAHIPVAVHVKRYEPGVLAEVVRAGATEVLFTSEPDEVLDAKVRRLVEGGRVRRQLASAKRYISDPVRKQLERQLPAEQIEATVLFSDLRGFTAVAQGHDEAEIFDALSEFHAQQADFISEHEGYVDSFSGDGLLAVFAGGDAPDHAVDACRDILAWGASRPPGLWSPVPVGIGVHTGVVIRGNMGSEFRMGHTVIGHTVNVSARLCGIATPLTAVVSEHTVASMSAQDWSLPMSTVHLKGVAGPFRVSLLGPPAVGRQRELLHAS